MHGVQTRSAVAEQPRVSKLPAAHALQVSQTRLDVTLQACVSKVSATHLAHGAHTRLCVDVQASVSNVPLAHGVHGVVSGGDEEVATGDDALDGEDDDEEMPVGKGALVGDGAFAEAGADVGFVDASSSPQAATGTITVTTPGSTARRGTWPLQ